MLIMFSQGQQLIREKLSGRYLSVFFDGTTRVCEAMGIAVRYVDSERCVQ